MDLLLAPVGSHGDVHPYIGLGKALVRRGHQVTLITSGHFESLARKAGLEFVELGSAAEFDSVTADPLLWHPTKSFRYLFERAVLPTMRTGYEIIAERYRPGRTIVAASGISFGARLAHERLGVPLATLHLQPVVFRSVHRTPVLGSPALPDWTPRPIKRCFFAALDVLLLDRVVGPPLNRFRAELGLPPVRRILADWWHSPQCTIGLFPDWYAAPQPDWPPNTHLTGFPLYDEGDQTDPSRALEEFLESGSAPIVFTPGSAMRHGRAFFEAAVEACRLLGRRGLLLTRYREQLPAQLPDGIGHLDYVPFSAVLPRAAAVVHHGGIGSVAQGLAAGVPQLVTPFGYDQHDNADRLRRLGVGRAVRRRAVRGRAVAAALEELLTSDRTATNCDAVAAKFTGAEPLTRTCELLEGLANRDKGPRNK